MTEAPYIQEKEFMIDKIFAIINQVVIVLVILTMALQMIYSLFIFIPPKKYKKAKVQHKYAVLIAARNEESVIGYLIESLKQQNYPQELLDIFVVAHNCTDRTREIAEQAGATVFVLNDDDPARKRKGYALRHGFERLLKEYPDHEGYFVFDADNLVSPDFVAEMNNAFDSGAKVGQGFRNSKNLEQNAVAGVNGLFFLRDCVFNAHARTLIHSSPMIFGTGFLFAREVIADTGWTAFNLAEDAEFSAQLVLKKYRNRYVAKAEFFDEQPTSFMQSMQRQSRVGRGTCQLFFKYGYKLLFKFFTRFRLAYLDTFLALMYAPVSLLCVVWFPFYYIYQPITMLVAGDMAALQSFLIMIAQMVGLYILIPITIQNLLIYLFNWKRLKIKSVWKLILTLLFFPIYNFGCALAITIGIINPKVKWKQVKHTESYSLEQMERKKSKNTDEESPPDLE